MYWSHYVITSADLSWNCLPTVTETAERVAKQEASAKLLDRFAAVNDVDGFVDRYDSAKAEAKAAGWSDDGIEPVVFWVPIEDDVAEGFAFRQSDGKAYILSPVALPHLVVAAANE